MKRTNKKCPFTIFSYIWVVPIILSFVIGILNPYSGILGTIAVVFGGILPFSLQRYIMKNMGNICEKYGEKSDAILSLYINNWFLTSFSLLIVNAVINFILLYVCHTMVETTGDAIALGFLVINGLLKNWNIVYLLFVGNVFFNICATALVFVENKRLKKVFLLTPEKGIEE